MATNLYLNPDLSINRQVVFSCAWATARYNLALDRKLGIATTLKRCFSAALAKHWDLAKGYRATAKWHIAQDARVAALSEAGRKLHHLQQARVCAEMIDSTSRMRFEVAAIDAEISALRVAA